MRRSLWGHAKGIHFWFFCALFGLFLLLQVLIPYNEFWDDAYISILYARNVARGVGPVFLPFNQEDVTSYRKM